MNQMKYQEDATEFIASDWVFSLIWMRQFCLIYLIYHANMHL